MRNGRAGAREGDSSLKFDDGVAISHQLGVEFQQALRLDRLGASY